MRYYWCVIKTFKCPETQTIFEGHYSPRLPQGIQRVAKRKLDYVHAASQVNDLRIPPGNRLEALKGNRKGQHSIRINDQWRICLVWRDDNAYQVEIVDYH